MAIESEAVIGWAAGVFEGEGCVGIYRRGRGQVRLSLEMADRDVVERFAAAVGAGAVSERPSRDGRKPTFVWRLSAAGEVVRVLEVLRPWFGVRRSAKAGEAVDVARAAVERVERSHCKHGHPFSGANLIEVVERGRRRRVCRACRSARRRAWYARSKAAA